MKLIVLSILLLPTLFACTATITDHHKVAESISVFDISCTAPYQLTRDCGEEFMKRGPRKKAEINGYSFVYASTEDGRVIRMASFEDHAGSIVDTLTFGVADVTGVHLEKVLLAIESALNEQGVYVTRIVPIIIPSLGGKIGDMGESFGYFLELDGDGYSVLEEYATDLTTE